MPFHRPFSSPLTCLTFPGPYHPHIRTPNTFKSMLATDCPTLVNCNIPNLWEAKKKWWKKPTHPTSTPRGAGAGEVNFGHLEIVFFLRGISWLGGGRLNTVWGDSLPWPTPRRKKSGAKDPSRMAMFAILSQAKTLPQGRCNFQEQKKRKNNTPKV